MLTHNVPRISPTPYPSPLSTICSSMFMLKCSFPFLHHLQVRVVEGTSWMGMASGINNVADDGRHPRWFSCCCLPWPPTWHCFWTSFCYSCCILLIVFCSGVAFCNCKRPCCEELSSSTWNVHHCHGGNGLGRGHDDAIVVATGL